MQRPGSRSEPEALVWGGSPGGKPVGTDLSERRSRAEETAGSARGVGASGGPDLLEPGFVQHFLSAC